MIMCKDCENCDHYPICEWCAENTDFNFPEEDGICQMAMTVGDKTMGDKIRRMSDEELAHELALIAGWDRKEYAKAKVIGLEKVMLDWLRQPVKE